MKAATRLALLLAVGLSLTGCASQTTDKSKSASADPSLREKTEGGNDHWFQRNLNDNFDRQRGQP